MTKEELIELKRKLSILSKEENKKRDLYLKKIALGEVEGPVTGYPTIDKPWLKYIDVEKVYEKKNDYTVYEEIYNKSKDFPNRVALEFFGRVITYKELFENINKCANTLLDNGVKEGDFVTICSAGTPEMVYLFYALSKIGAIANFVPPYFDKKNMVDRIKDCNSKHMFVMDTFYDSVKDSIDESGIENVVIMPLLNSSLLRFIKKTPKVKNPNVKYWNKFIGKDKTDRFTYKYKPNKPLALIYSSGSTGDLKAILLSNESFQNSIHSYDACAISMDYRQKFYQIIPPWFSTGLSTSIHLPLSKGATVFMDPRIDKKTFVNNIVKRHINATVATATMYDGFVENPPGKRVDLSGFTNAFEGGEPFKEARKRKIEKVLENHGCRESIKIGYGQCESGSGITTQTDDFYCSDESIGIPIPGVTVGIFDSNFNELPYNEKGQILALTKCAMIEYYKNPKATSEYFHTDEFGQRWSCTGDLGCIDEDGMVYIYGRQSDFSTINGKKIYNFDVEKTIIDDEDINNCAVVSQSFGKEEENLAVHLVLSKDFLQKSIDNPQMIEDKFIGIQNKLYEKFGEIEYVPKYFKVRDSIPTAKSSKRDNKALKMDIDNFTYVEFDDNKKIFKKNK